MALAEDTPLDQVRRVALMQAAVAHELRNRATAVVGFADVLDQSLAGASGTVREALHALRSNTLELVALLDGALDESSTLLAPERRPGTVDLALLVEEVAGRRHPGLREHGVRLRIRGPVWARGDAGGVRRIVVELLVNAAKHSPSEATITISVCARGAEAVVTVDDEGDGVPDDCRALLFEPGWRGPGTTTGTGRGLGLAIAAELARSMGGALDVGDSPSGGARFTLRLPRRALRETGQEG